MAVAMRMDDKQRRARLGVRHHLAPAARSGELVEVARDLVGLHSTDPASVFLAARARMRTASVEGIERDLYDRRTVVRILGMRLTIFVVPVELFAIVHAAVTRTIEVRERRKLVQLLEQAVIARDGTKWLRRIEDAIVRALAGRGEGTAVELDGVSGLVLNDDLELAPAPDPWVALLPALDPTVMGWSPRGWFLGGHGPALFDRSGNAGPTVWWDGRVVGSWAQRKDGEIAVRLLEDVGADAVAAVEAETDRLGSWLGPLRFTPRFRTPLERELAG
jgi:Winged helix DNA-binding domain